MLSEVHVSLDITDHMNLSSGLVTQVLVVSFAENLITIDLLVEL